MVYYKLVKIIIDARRLAKIIIDIIIHQYSLPDSIVINKGSFLYLKFWPSLCYFLSIKHWLFIVFYLQTNGKTKKQNSTMEAYLQAFVNFKQNN